MYTFCVEFEWSELSTQTVQCLQHMAVLEVLQVFLLQEQKLHFLKNKSSKSLHASSRDSATTNSSNSEPYYFVHSIKNCGCVHQFYPYYFECVERAKYNLLQCNHKLLCTCLVIKIVKVGAYFYTFYILCQQYKFIKIYIQYQLLIIKQQVIHCSIVQSMV